LLFLAPTTTKQQKPPIMAALLHNYLTSRYCVLTKCLRYYVSHGLGKNMIYWFFGNYTTDKGNDGRPSSVATTILTQDGEHVKIKKKII
jgi:hypothetical protein